MPGWKIIQVINKKLKPEKQRRICFLAIRSSKYIYISICVCIELFIYILNLLFQPSCLEIIPRNAYMTVCSRYEEALSLELESYP